MSVNAAYNKNEITELAGGRDLMEAGMQVGQNQAITYHKVGKPANSFLVYQQVYDESGRPIMGCYVDRNGDGTIDENDRYFYKNIVAPWTGGFSFKVAYKNWDLGSNFRASFGNYLYNGYAEGAINTKRYVVQRDIIKYHKGVSSSWLDFVQLSSYRLLRTEWQLLEVRQHHTGL